MRAGLDADEPPPAGSMPETQRRRLAIDALAAQRLAVNEALSSLSWLVVPPSRRHILISHRHDPSRPAAPNRGPSDHARYTKFLTGPPRTPRQGPMTTNAKRLQQSHDSLAHTDMSPQLNTHNHLVAANQKQYSVSEIQEAGFTGFNRQSVEQGQCYFAPHPPSWNGIYDFEHRALLVIERTASLRPPFSSAGIDHQPTDRPVSE